LHVLQRVRPTDKRAASTTTFSAFKTQFHQSANLDEVKAVTHLAIEKILLRKYSLAAENRLRNLDRLSRAGSTSASVRVMVRVPAENLSVKHSLTPYRTTMHSHHRGFTLVELMVVVALVGVLAMLAVPSWEAIQTRTAIRTLVNDYTSSLAFARSEAVRQNTAVTVCPSNNGAACTDSNVEAGWIVFTTVPVPVILQDTLPRARVRTAYAINDVASRAITYLPNGQVRAMVGNTLWICPTNPTFDGFSRNIVMNATTRVRIDSPNACQIPVPGP
jgi:type IV fimbrial biogenesis protein FimT